MLFKVIWESKIYKIKEPLFISFVYVGAEPLKESRPMEQIFPRNGGSWRLLIVP